MEEDSSPCLKRRSLLNDSSLDGKSWLRSISNMETPSPPLPKKRRGGASKGLLSQAFDAMIQGYESDLNLAKHRTQQKSRSRVQTMELTILEVSSDLGEDVFGYTRLRTLHEDEEVIVFLERSLNPLRKGQTLILIEPWFTLRHGQERVICNPKHTKIIDPP